MKPIRILHSELTSSIGGIESFLLNIYSHIDRNEFQFDCISHSQNPAFETQLRDLGARVFYVPRNPVAYSRAIKKLMQQRQYSAIHIHKNSAANLMPFLAARGAKIPSLICHAHNTHPAHASFVANNLHILNRALAYKLSTYHLACSDLAAKWMYGFQSAKALWVPNGIDLARFAFNENQRNELRRTMRLESRLVLGSVSRFTTAKNHMMQLQILQQVLRTAPNAILMLVGAGKEMEAVQACAVNLNLKDNTMFLGERKDTHHLLQAMDVFLLPSLYEGLPISIIEAQAAGLPCLVSETVTRQCNICSCTFLPISQGSSPWVTQSLQKFSNARRAELSLEAQNSVFDIRQVAAQLQELYRMMAVEDPKKAVHLKACVPFEKPDKI